MLKSLLLKQYLSTLLAGVATATAQPVTTLTLEEAHRLARGNYQLIQAVGEQVEQARHVRRSLISYVMPSVSLQTVLTHNFVSAEFEFGGQNISVLPANDYNVALVVSQPIYAGLRDLKAIRQANIGIDVAGKSYETTVQDSLLAVTRAYYTVLALQDNVEITRRSVEVTEETLRSAESLFRAGESVETAVLRARVANTNAERELIEARNSLAIAKKQLALLTGITSDFEASRPPTPDRLDAPVEELIEEGFKARRELQSLTLQREIAELEIQKERGAYLPVVRAEATFIQRRATFPSNRLGSVAVNASWDVFDGGRRAAGVANAKSRLREVELNRELLSDRIEQEIQTAYLNVETRSASVDMLRAQVEFARRNDEATSRAFRVGEATDLDVITANATLTRSERELTGATYQLEITMYELLRAVGTFAEEEILAMTGGEE